MWTPRMGRPPSALTPGRAAVAAAVGFALWAAFQAALASGAPLGHAAWGGETAELSTNQRVGSAVSVAVYGAAALLVLGRARGWGRGTASATLFRRGAWVVAALLAGSALLNAASPSPWESFLNAPVAVVLAVLCAVVAHGGRAGAATSRTN